MWLHCVQRVRTSVPVAISVLGSLATCASPLTAHAQDFRYAVIELPGLSIHQWAGASAVNSIGDCVGFTALGPFHIHAVLWPHDGGVVDLGTLGGDNSSAQNMNDNGDVVGWANWDPNLGFLDQHAFLWRDGQMIDLGTLGGDDSVAYGINDLGQVVGEAAYEKKSGRRKAFVWEDGQMRALPAPHPDWDGRAAFDINNSREAVGYGLDTNAVFHALLWRDDEMFDLGALASEESTAYAINHMGVVAGDSITANQRRHSVKWVSEEIHDIHTPSAGPFSTVRGLNEVGQFVGDNGASSKGLILNPNEEWIPLDDLVPPRLRLLWTITRANGINDAGQIAVNAEYDSDSYALLLTPVTPTMNLQGPQPDSATACASPTSHRVSACSSTTRATAAAHAFPIATCNKTRSSSTNQSSSAQPSPTKTASLPSPEQSPPPQEISRS